jgi:hypothetical protein
MQNTPKPATLELILRIGLAAPGGRRLADIYTEGKRYVQSYCNLGTAAKGFKEERKIYGFQGQAGI